MPRNKTAKRTNKSQTMSNILVSVQKMEKDFIQTPSRLAAQLSKEVNAHKQQENKLKNALNKIKSTLKNAETRVKSAIKVKHTSTGKKQFKIAKKVQGEAVKLHNDLNKQLQAISKALESLLNKHAKLSALGKHVRQFDKEWSKASKKTKVKAKAKTQTRKAKVKTRTASSVVEQTQHHPVESTYDTSLDETAEFTS
jgi:septal ring factor EnvC (AmiA/AmiB activator)